MMLSAWTLLFLLCAVAAGGNAALAGEDAAEVEGVTVPDARCDLSDGQVRGGQQPCVQYSAKMC